MFAWRIKAESLLVVHLTGNLQIIGTAGVQFTGARHEATSVYMAEVYADRLFNNPVWVAPGALVR